jgi:hypothetical protein
LEEKLSLKESENKELFAFSATLNSKYLWDIQGLKLTNRLKLGRRCLGYCNTKKVKPT